MYKLISCSFFLIDIENRLNWSVDSFVTFLSADIRAVKTYCLN